MKDLESKKDKFIRRELWMLTYMAAFQRANIYTKLDQVSEKARKEFRDGMFIWCNELVEQQYHAEVSGEKHIENIHALVKYTSKYFPDILDNRRIKFGIAQKILNLYLKYLWCIGDIPTPPHFPIDRIIQDLLKLPKRYSWTKMDSVEEYKMVINQSKKVMNRKQFSSLSELELKYYNRPR
ncbi:hypothetical protein [uncultured Christiangramia sp.]|uniref:hypothetical protein n=1 Tax=uncultured Christiangramia sp. TaxID=503836 RepID=UPI0026265290|nr:hypothetical protein [uncultured Christiangramia sp.]